MSSGNKPDKRRPRIAGHPIDCVCPECVRSLRNIERSDEYRTGREFLFAVLAFLFGISFTIAVFIATCL